MKEIRTALHILFWFSETVWLGSILMVRSLRFTWGWLHSFQQRRRCPRGHLTPMYGVYECRCKAIIEGHVFSECPACGQSAGWTPCLRCGLPIRNQLL